MARKQFVSSKKNAPSRAVSSKEAALHSRVGDVDNGDENGEEVDVDDDDDNDDDSSGSATPGSPASSNGSSSLFTSDEQDEAIGNGAGDVDTPSQSSEAPVAVEVMPSSVGRGKQLRFPTVISRGKESRVFTQDGSQDEDGDSDSDDSLLSIASDEEEEDDKSSVDGAIATQQKEQPEQQQQQDEDTTMLDESETTKQQDEIDSPSVAAGYPIKGFRARKRHRPDSGYYKQMSTYVRDCLLSVRDGAEAADVLTEESHDEFRRKLSAGTVERVTWKESSPSVEEPVTAPAAAAKSVAPAVVSEKKKEEPPADQVKKEKHKKEHRTREKRSESSSGSKSSSSSSNRKREEASASSSSSNSRKREEAASASSSTSSSRAKETPEPAKSIPEVKKEEVKKEVKREERSVSSSSVKAEQLTESTRRIKTEPSSTILSSGKTSSSSNGASSSSAAEEKSRSTSGSTQQTPALCSSCKKKLSDDKEPEKPPPAPKKTVTIAPEAKESLATFIIPTATGKDVTKLRAEATKLNDEARALKHEGNRKGAAEPGSAGQIAQGKFYLRSSAKFFQHALKLADIKAAYKEVGDERHARQYGDYSVTTLSQTSSLIESTIRTFQSAGSARMVALGYKLASIVHLTIYRMQHLKLFSLYSDLFTPGRSPDTRQNGTPTPPIGGTNPDSKEAAVRTHLLKEMEHTLRGFEMWRRYESCKVVVLPRITNPAIADLSVLFEDLHSELGSA